MSPLSSCPSCDSAFYAAPAVSDNPTTFEDRSLPVVIDEATGDFEFYDNTLHIEDDQFMLEIWDTAGQEAMESLRTLAYPKTHVFLVGFSMDKVATLENVESEWQRELNEQASTCSISKNAPRILIGTKVTALPACLCLPLPTCYFEQAKHCKSNTLKKL